MTVEIINTSISVSRPDVTDESVVLIAVDICPPIPHICGEQRGEDCTVRNTCKYPHSHLAVSDGRSAFVESNAYK